MSASILIADDDPNILLALKSRRTVSRTLFWKTEPDQRSASTTSSAS